MSNTPTEDIVGGKGTIFLGAGQTLEANISKIYVRENAPNLALFREKYTDETSFVNVTAEHYKGTTPLAQDIINGKGYIFGKVEVGASGSICVILAD